MVETLRCTKQKPWLLEQMELNLYEQRELNGINCGRQRGRVVRAPDLKFGGHGFKSRSGHLVAVVSRWTLVQLLGHACK